MSKINDGGPAFPCDWVDFQPGTGVQVVREQFSGVSVLDWFARGALTSVEWYYSQNKPAIIARQCFDMAAAMLAERERRAGKCQT